MKLKEKYYKQIKQRLGVLKAKGVEIKFNSYKPHSHSEGNMVFGFCGGTEEAPEFPKVMIINSWDSNTDIITNLSKIEDQLEIWEEFTESNYYRLKQYFNSSDLINALSANSDK